MDRVERRMDNLEQNLDDTRKELNTRMDRLEQNLDATRKELNDNINDLRSSMQSSTNHGQIATISTVGIALAVLYSLFFK